jgi:hypothetical protein
MGCELKPHEPLGIAHSEVRRFLSSILASAMVGSVIFITPLLVYHTLIFGLPFHVGYQKHQIFGGMKEGIVGITYTKFTVKIRHCFFEGKI